MAFVNIKFGVNIALEQPSDVFNNPSLSASKSQKLSISSPSVSSPKANGQSQD